MTDSHTTRLYNPLVCSLSVNVPQSLKNRCSLNVRIQTFLAYAHSGDLLDYVFADLQTQGFGIYQDHQTAVLYLSNPDTGVQIHESTYLQIVELIRKINLYEHITARPANETARQYLIEKERKRLKRLAKKPPEPYLEQMVIALVNTAEFPYDYESCMHLSIYAFNQSFKPDNWTRMPSAVCLNIRNYLLSVETMLIR